MKNLKLNDILNIVNEEKEKRGMENFAPCYPMLRIVDNKLYIAVMISDFNSNIWEQGSNCIPEYWCLLDPKNHKILEYNKTSEKKFAEGKISALKPNITNELLEFEERKKIEYEKMIINDVKQSKLPLQDKIFKSLNGEISLNNKTININDYIMENLDDLIKIKSKELVDILVQSKYSLITICYDNLFSEIINEYNNSGNINKEKMKLCIEIMQNYYYGITGIKEFFNL